MTDINIINEIKKLNVLIVEDGDDIRGIMENTFSKLCDASRVAIDGVDGLKQFKEEKPDIILTDIRMPNMNGNELIDNIKIIEPNMPIIVVSGHGRLIKANPKADYIFEKPIKFDKLLEAMYKLTR